MRDRSRRNAAWGAAVAAAAMLVAGAAAAEGYDKKFRDDFMQSCIASGGTYTVCQCTMLQIESQIRFEKFTEMQKAARSGGKADQGVLDRYEKIVAGCVDRERR